MCGVVVLAQSGHRCFGLA